MKNVDKAFDRIDRKVDKNIGPVKRIFNKFFPVFSALLISIMIILFVFRFFYTRPFIIATIIQDDIKLISAALEKIDSTCSILSLEDDYNEIDFLNTKAFAGSQVGPVNLAYPDKWDGPYLRVNPTIQKIYYEIVSAKDGIFVMPGRGVRLPNGVVIGKDVKVTHEINVMPLLNAKGPLQYEGIQFASKLPFKIGDWKPWHLQEKTVKELDKMIQEFNEAMPFTCNPSIQFSSGKLLGMSGPLDRVNNLASK